MVINRLLRAHTVINWTPSSVSFQKTATHSSFLENSACRPETSTCLGYFTISCLTIPSYSLVWNELSFMFTGNCLRPPSITISGKPLHISIHFPPRSSHSSAVTVRREISISPHILLSPLSSYLTSQAFPYIIYQLTHSQKHSSALPYSLKANLKMRNQPIILWKYVWNPLGNSLPLDIFLISSSGYC